MVHATPDIIVFEFILKQILFLTSSVYAVPVLLGFAISFYGINPQIIALDDIKKLASTSLFLSVGGMFTAFAEPAMVYYNLSIQGLAPRIPDFFEKGMLAYTTSALCHGVGIIPLLLFNVKLATLPQHTQSKKLTRSFFILLILSGFLFFISIVVRSWPLAQYPEGIDKGYLCMLLLQQALHQFIDSFTPAGICTLALHFFIHCRGKDSAIPTLQNSYHPIYVRRFCYLICIVGLAPQGLMALGRITNFFLNVHTPYQPVTALGQSFFLVCSLIFFCLLLVPRFTISRFWQCLAILGYFIFWNWSSILAFSQY